jgi:hypothetical protein
VILATIVSFFTTLTVMANLICSTKSGSEWTLSNLDSYNIHIVFQELLEFFGVQDLPNPIVDPELLDKLEARAMQQDRNAELITLLDLAMVRSLGESAVDDFAVELFKITEYVYRTQVARTRKDLNLLVCGKWKHAKMDVCIVDRDQNDILLLVQEDMAPLLLSQCLHSFCSCSAFLLRPPSPTFFSHIHMV